MEIPFQRYIQLRYKLNITRSNWTPPNPPRRARFEPLSLALREGFVSDNRSISGGAPIEAQVKCLLAVREIQ